MLVIVKRIRIYSYKELTEVGHILKTDRDKIRYFIKANQNPVGEDA